MSDCFVYWLFDATCADPAQHGYVGITTNVTRRVSEHRRGRFIGKSFDFRILFVGSRSQCEAMEAELRPIAGVAWNIDRGGPKGRQFRLQSTRDKLRAAEETRARLREASARRWHPESVGA